MHHEAQSAEPALQKCNLYLDPCPTWLIWARHLVRVAQLAFDLQIRSIKWLELVEVELVSAIVV